MSAESEPTLVSIVVPTRNSEQTLPACLESVRSQTYPALELIVVDNNSSDRTLDQAGGFADVILKVGPERSAQRNAGARAARGFYLLFVDSDMVLEPSVVAACVEAADDAAAVVIPEDSFGLGFWARCKALERSCYVGDDLIEAARFFPRPLFFDVGGFDEALVGAEDWDLHGRVRSHGYSIARIGAFIHHDDGKLGLARLVSKKFRYGKDFGRYRRKHPQLARKQARLVRPAFVRHRRRLLAEPLLLAGMIVMKTCEIAAGGTGLLAASVGRRRR